ncbi:THUMP domain-containing protein [Candidatus Bathyarchaeota archaeon]|nr:THUMP domain-containing protein [Candidatus Bathyarchaeota archaeon]
MLEDFNLLISTGRGYEGDACSEIWYFLSELGDSTAQIDKTGISGLVVAKTKLDPFQVVEKLRAIMKERPWDFRYILKVTPIERVVRSDLNAIRLASAEIASKIQPNETFRVTVEKRHSELSTTDVIEAAAAEINRKVNLENPDKIVLVEILGHLTGLSVIRATDVLAVIKEKRPS